MAFPFSLRTAVFLALLASANAAPPAGDWESTVNPHAPGSFPELRPMRLQYSFGWNGITAAEAVFKFFKTPDGRLQLDATGHTTGAARGLWPFDVTHVSSTDAHSLRPLQVRETEVLRSKKFETQVDFTPQAVTSKRDEERGAVHKSKTRQLQMANLHSIDSALLYLRTQPLHEGPQRIVVYPSTSAYLCTITPAGREHITIATGSYDAIKLDLQLNKIGKKRELLPHKKFRRATVWLSDDPNRLVLRIEAQIFAGTIFAELQSLQFEDGKP
jgi:hypothetical protein